MRRRDQRSISTPANGPITEKGITRIARALATPAAVLCWSGERNTSRSMRNAWKTPSANWLRSRARSNRAKSGERRAARARATLPLTAGARSLPLPGRLGGPGVGRGGLGLCIEEGRPVGGLRCAVADDELLDHLARGLVGELHRRGLHEVRGRSDQGAGDP